MEWVFVYFGVSIVSGIVADLKGRCGWCWFFYSLLFSPLICIIVLLFLGSVEKYEYFGEDSLSNDSYKVYLTKKYKILSVDTIEKFECRGNIYDSSIDALRFAQSLDKHMTRTQLETTDPL